MLSSLFKCMGGFVHTSWEYILNLNHRARPNWNHAVAPGKLPAVTIPNKKEKSHLAFVNN